MKWILPPLLFLILSCAPSYVYHVRGDWATQIAKCDRLCATDEDITPGYKLTQKADSDIAVCTCEGLIEEQILRDRGFYD